MVAYWEPIVILAILNSVQAYGFYVTMSSGMLSMVHACLAGLAGYGSAILTTNFGAPFAVAIVAGILIGGSVGFILGVVTARMSLLVSSLATMGFGLTMSVLAYNWDYIGGANSFIGIPLKTTFALALASLVVVVLFVWRLDRAYFGYAARATRDDPMAAAAGGLNVVKIRSLAFLFGGGIAGLGGVLSAHYLLVVSPADLGFWPSLYIQIYVIFGGSYSMWGPLIGAGTITILTEVLRFAGSYRYAAYGLVLLLVLIFRPEGIVRRRPRGLREGRRPSVLAGRP